MLYWQFCRPFLKPNYRQYLAKSLHQVVKALDDIDDKDYGWRAQLMMWDIFFYLFSFTDILVDCACSLCYCLLGSLVRPKVVRSVHYCPQTKKTLVRRYTDLTSLDAFPTSSVYPTKVSLVFGLNLHYLIFVTILTVNCPCVDFFWCYKVEVFMGVLWHLRRVDRVSCVIKVRWSMSLDKTSQLC